MSTSQWYWSWVKSREATAKASNAVPQSGGVFYSYRAPERGQLSAADLKTSFDSISTNINQQWSLWNNHIRPILDSLPSGARDQRWNSGRGLPEKIDALSYGLQGTTLFVFNDADATRAYGRYWDEVAGRPKTIAESIEDLWVALSEVDTAASTSSASVDLSSLWNAIGSWYYNGSSSTSGSIDYRLLQLESNSNDLLHDLYSTDAGLGFTGYGFPLHGVAEFIHYLAIEHGVASGWNGGDPSAVSHTAFTTPTLDQAYDAGGSGLGRVITANAGAVELTVPSGYNNVAFIVNQNNNTHNPTGIEISNLGTGASLLLSGTTKSITSTTGSLSITATSGTTASIVNTATTAITFDAPNVDIVNRLYVDTLHPYTGTGTGTSGAPRIFLGTNVSSGDDSAILIGRDVAGTDLFSHAIRDESTFTSLNTGAYASFDSAVEMTGTIAYNHIHAFQSRMKYSGVGVLSGYQAFTTNPNITAGTVTNLIGLHVYDAIGAGTVQNQFGVYIDELAKGTVNNYAIYSPGVVKSWHAGQFQVGSGGILSTVGTIKMTNIWCDDPTGSTALGIGVPSSSYPGNYMTVVGHEAGKVLGSSANNFNTFIGWRAGYSVVNTHASTLIGAGAGYLGTGGGRVCLGKYAGYYETGANKLFIDNDQRASEADARVKALVYGIFDAAVANQYFTINGNLVATQGATIQSIPFTEVGNTSLVNFTATSVIGALNELKATPAGDSEDGMTVYKNIYGDFSAVYKDGDEIEVFGLPFSISTIQIKRITRKPTGSAASVVKTRGTDLVCTWTPDGTILGKGSITTTSFGTLASTDEYIVEIEAEPKAYNSATDSNKTMITNQLSYVNDGLVIDVSSDTAEIVKELLIDGYNAISVTVSKGDADTLVIYGSNADPGDSIWYNITDIALGTSSVSLSGGSYQSPQPVMFQWIKIAADGTDSDVKVYLTRYKL